MLHLSKFSPSNFCAIAKSLPQTNHYFTLFAGSYAEIIIGQFTTNFSTSMQRHNSNISLTSIQTNPNCRALENIVNWQDCSSSGTVKICAAC